MFKYLQSTLKRCLGATVKLLSCDLEVAGSSLENNFLQKKK